MTVKLLGRDDHTGQLIELMRQLAPVHLAESELSSIYVRQRDEGSLIAGAFDEDNNLVGVATLLIESKVIHRGGRAAHIEDVVVDSASRGRGVGRQLISFLLDLAQREGCYKAVLNCSKGNVGFYQKCGFQLTPDAFMRIDL